MNNNHKFIATLSGSLFGAFFIAWIFAGSGSEPCYIALTQPYFSSTFIAVIIGFGVSLMAINFNLRILKLSICNLLLLVLYTTIAFIISIQLLLYVNCDIRLKAVYNVILPSFLGLLLGLMSISGYKYLKK